MDPSADPRQLKTANALKNPPVLPGAALGPASLAGWTRTDTWIFLALCAAALAVRLVYLWQSRTGPTFYTPIVDADTYHQMAIRLSRRYQMDEGFFWQPFFYPFALAVFYKVLAIFGGGPSIVAAKLVQALLGALTCGLTYRLGRTVFNRPIGIIAAGVVALYGPLIFYESELLGAGLAALWSVLLILMLLWARRADRDWRSFAALGAVGALAVLTRPTFLPFLVVALVWVFWTMAPRPAMWASRARLASGALAGFLMVVAMPVYWTHQAIGHFTFLPSSGGINLYIGNNPDMDRTLLIRPGWEWENLTNKPREMDLSVAQEESYFRDKVVEFARTQPGAFLGNMAAKTARYICPREMPRNEDPYMFSRWSGLLGALMWKAGPFGFPFGVVFPLAVVGLVLYARRMPAVVWLLPVLHGAALVLVFVTARYRVEAAPLLAVLAGCGVWGLVDLVRARRWLATAGCVVLAVGLAAGGSLAGPFVEEKVNYQAELAFDIGGMHFRARQYQQSLEDLQEAIRLRGDYGDAYTMLGNSQAMLKHLDDAIASYHKAVAINPTNAKAWHSLGSVTLAKGDLDGAIGFYQRAIRECAVNPETWGAYGEVLRRKGRWQESADAYAQAARHTRGNRALRLERQFKSVLSLWRVGKPAPVLEALERLRAEAPDQPQVLLGLAWLKATCPEAPYRNGAEALALAQRGLARGGRTIPAFEALAAAQAETGQFDQALRSAEEAQVLTIGQPDQTTKMQTIRRRADLYRARQPYRGSEPPVDLEK